MSIKLNDFISKKMPTLKLEKAKFKILSDLWQISK